MSALMAEWFAYAREVTGFSNGDRLFLVEDDDARVAFPRRVASGAIVDGRPGKPGVMLLVVTSEGDTQELGVSSREQAAGIVAALRDAWGDL